MEIRNFTQDEIGELNNYITTQIPHTVLPSLFVLTEEPLKKALAYISIYRILTGVRDFSEKDSTKKKIDSYLEKHNKIYNELYPLYIAHKTDETEIGKLVSTQDVIRYVIKENILINRLVNDFLVFAEKQELMSTDEVAGLNLEKPEGEELYKRIMNNAKID